MDHTWTFAKIPQSEKFGLINISTNLSPKCYGLTLIYMLTDIPDQRIVAVLIANPTTNHVVLCVDTTMIYSTNRNISSLWSRWPRTFIAEFIIRLLSWDSTVQYVLVYYLFKIHLLIGPYLPVISLCKGFQPKLICILMFPALCITNRCDSTLLIQWKYCLQRIICEGSSSMISSILVLLLLSSAQVFAARFCCKTHRHTFILIWLQEKC